MSAMVEMVGQVPVHGLAVALGWTLLHFCWQGASVAVVLWCVLGVLDGRPARVRYGVALFALGLMVALPLITFGRLAAEVRRESGPSAFGGLRVRDDRQEQTQIPSGNDKRMVGAAAVLPLKERVAILLDEAAPWVPGVWLVGVVLFLGRLNLGLMVARRMKSERYEGTAPAAVELQTVLRELAGRLGVRRAVRLLNSAVVQVPTVIGWLRPVVLLPVGCFTGLSEMQIEALLAHELAHIRRHDYLVSVAQSVVEALLFYHPAVWWVSRQVRRERECCCDDLAVGVGGDRLAYAKALSFLEERRAFTPEIVLGANGGVLTMRIRRLLGYRENAAGAQVAAVVLLAALFVTGAMFIGAAARAQSGSGAESPPATPSEAPAPTPKGVAVPDPLQRRNADRALFAANPGLVTHFHGDKYATWLNQDVVWIISSQEREAFKHLANDNERDAFIEQFWARRNPAPDAPENSFKTEHYARIAYANERFGAADVPGWKTDRGHIYIAYGKPDSIDSHPSGGQYQRPDGSGATETFPFEVWHYRAVPGIGENVDVEFVDTCRCGSYHYTIDQTEKDLLKGGPGMAGVQRQDVDRAVKILAAPVVSYEGAIVREVNYEGLNSVTLAEVRERFKREGIEIHVGMPYDRAMVARAAGELKKLLVERGRSSAAVIVVGPMQPGARLRFVVREVTAGKVAEAAEAQIRVGDVYARDYTRDLSKALVAQEEYRLLLQQFPDSPKAPEAAQRLREVQASIAELETQRATLQLQAAKMQVAAAPPVAASSGDATKPQRIWPGVAPAALISRVDPVYPPGTVFSGGPVSLFVTVSKTGAVSDVQVVSGPPQLLVGAIDVVRQWKYRPFLLNGEPVEAKTVVTFEFSSSGELLNRNGSGSATPKQIREGVSAPVVLYQVDPEMTPEEKAAKFGGIVTVNLWVDEQGDVTRVRVVQGMGKGLDERAVEAVKQWKFRPAMEDGKPVAVELDVEVMFRVGVTVAEGSGGAAGPNKVFLVFVEGSVKHPGPCALGVGGSKATVLRALELAGGPTKTAAPNRAELIRKVANGTVETRLSVGGILSGKLSDIPMLPGDVLYVPSEVPGAPKARLVSGADGGQVQYSLMDRLAGIADRVGARF